MPINLRPQYIFWEATFRFVIDEPLSLWETPVSLGPFVDLNDFLSWRSHFIRGIREKEERFPAIRVKILREERFRQEAELAEEMEEDGFVEVTCLEPEEEGRLFFSESLREWIYNHNLQFVEFD